MKHSERSDEGYLMVNHKNSPGLSPEFLLELQKAFPGEDTLPPNRGHGMFEAPILKCTHCQGMIIVNPLRDRRRERCPSCFRYICDKCALNMKLGLECKPFEKVIEEIIEANSGNLKEF